MNTHVLDPHTDAELRSLDAASDVSGDPARRAATLDSILGGSVTAPASPASVSPATPLALGGRRRPVRRWAALGAIAAAVTGVAAIALPTITAAPSYASWTATPSVVNAADVELVREACVDKWGPMVTENNPTRTDDLAVQLAERRGNFVAMLLSHRSADRYALSVFCVASLPPGSDDVDDVELAGGGGGGLPAPGAREFTQGAISQFGGDPGAAMTEGEVGADVVGLTLRADGHEVVATIKDGAYAAWWPGKAFADFSGPSGEGGPEPAIAYDVTYADGTVAKDVLPTVPGGRGDIHTERSTTS